MATITYYVVQTFTRHPKGGVSADEAKQVPSREQAIRLATRLSEGKYASIAFSRTGDPATGDWEGAVVLFEAGPLTAELVELQEAI